VAAEVVVRHVVRRALDGRTVAVGLAVRVVVCRDAEERRLVCERAVLFVPQVPVNATREAETFPILPACERPRRDARDAGMVAGAAEGRCLRRRASLASRSACRGDLGAPSAVRAIPRELGTRVILSAAAKASPRLVLTSWRQAPKASNTLGHV
jgi:hypothetical protein